MMPKSGPTEGLIRWRKSTGSGSGNCVEVAGSEEAVLVRDTKNRAGAMLQFTPSEWSAFIDGARSGEFDVEILLGRRGRP